MLSLSDNNQADIIEAFKSTSRYLDDLLNIDNPYFEQMVGQIYPTELQLNKANSSDSEAPFLGLEKPKKYHAWSRQNVCDALTFFVGQHFCSIWHQAL